MFYTSLQEMLADAIKDPESFEHADRMYSQMYRSIAVVASESMEEDDLNYFGYNPTDLLVCLCNYKGEGEGDWEVLTEELKKLPVWKDKETSWAQVA